MSAVPDWQEEPTPPPAPNPARRSPVALLDATVWRGAELGRASAPVVGSGWPALDAELPGGGWPTRSLTEILQSQPTVAEWRLIAPALRSLVAAGQDVVVVGPPKRPHLPGLLHAGLEERRLAWIQAETPSERLWVTEQLIRANAGGAIVAWLPQARQEQIRRLQISAQASDSLVFLCRPIGAEHEPSAAPLRVSLSLQPDWAITVRVLKRRGPPQEAPLALPSVPGGLDAILTPRLRRPSSLPVAAPSRDTGHAVGRAAARAPVHRRIAAH
ncbi:MAG TPA: translesion DNA synthesis-associated protein ImuA [Methylibium sp.]|uniref:translesion DNA synthesis-associated protein ImuA n=1 Tax=Methylibium sp. TaxID=2067992 RepID=UPI002DBE3F89|nr:translesion DNA synthesis-associated protein ImuA [Methylibium sp.]HEU4460863.1 translesion DNA synthesis-associated protein ImuA [Methylibium sp.]